MKSILKSVLLLTVMLIFIDSAYGESYEEWLKANSSGVTEAAEEFESFKSDYDKSFNSYLDKEWKAFKVFSGVKAYKKPKPKTLPKLKTQPKKKNAKDKKPEKIVKIKKPKPLPKSIKKTQPKRQTPKTKYTGMADFGFYGRAVKFDYDPKLNVSLASGIDNKSISVFWKNVSNSDGKYVVDKLKQTKEDLDLNDWGYYRLVSKFSREVLSGGDKNSRILLMWYLLIQSGYEVKVGHDSSNAYLLLPVKNKLYASSFLTLDKGRKFYVFDDRGNTKLTSSVYTYKGNHKESKKVMDFYVKRAPLLLTTLKTKNIKFDYYGKKYDFDVKYRKSNVDYFKNYPQIDFDVYLNAPVSNEANISLVSALRPILSGKSEEDAVNILLRFTQKSFEYKTDRDQFGKENYLMPEETLFYPYSDCEDRTIIFAYLVRQLLGLQVVALHYPNHLAAAVKFSDDKSGDYVTHRGQKFIVTDPTYINANMGMAMPQFKNVVPKVIEIGL